MYKQMIWMTASALLLLALIGCPNETTPSTTNDTVVTDNSGDTTPTTLPNGSTKITSLQAVIDAASAGAVIDLSLSEYADITDYKAAINKSLTLQNGDDLKGASLTVSSDGVTLNGINSASVTTGSSLKIANSSLSSLTIAATSSSANANVIVGRGSTTGRGTDKAPTVEVTGSSVAEAISLGIAGAYLSVDGLDAKNAVVSLDAANTKLSIADKTTNIKEIKTDKICQVILEDGTSDGIPTPNVTDEGELTQIDMQAAGTLKLLALTPMSGLTTVVKKGEAIDFGNVIVLGTYQADDGVTVFKAGGLSYNLTETFSKLEKEFTITIGADEVYKDGQNVSAFDWTTLDAGEHSAKIDCGYEYKDGSYAAYTFGITVTEEAELPTPTLKSVEVYLGANVGTTYLAGDTLDLGTLLVMGVYEAGNISYKNILTDYTLSKQTGTVLTTADNAVTVSIPNETVTGTINLTVKPAVFVTFQVAEGQTIVSRIAQNTKVTAPLNISRIGYTFDSWYDDAACTNEHDFSTAVSSNTTIYAKWYPNAPHIITYHHQNGTADTTADFYEYDDVTLAAPTKTGYSLAGWCEDEACSGEAITAWRMGQKTADVNLWAKWTANQYDIIYKDENNAEFSADSTTDLPKKHTFDKATELVSPSRTGYEFLGWHKQPNCSDNSIDTLGASDYTDNITLYAKWNPLGYTISYIDLSADNDTATMVTDNCAKIHIYGTPTPIGIPTKMGHTFSGWYQSADNDNTIDTIAADYKQNITLYAKWTYGVDVSADGLSALMADLTSDYNPYLIRITDANPDLSVIKSALTTYPSITIDLDLSQCTEMTEIADNAFAGSYSNKITNLHGIVIPDGVTKIGNNSFYYCVDLINVTIPASVTNIGSASFSYCSNLNRVDYKGSLDQWISPSLVINTSPFYNSSNNVGLYINGELLTEVTIPDTITEIKRNVFEGYKKLTKLTIPASVKSIGNSSFSGCNSLTRVDYTGTLEQWCSIDIANYANPLQPGSAELYINDTLVTDVTLPVTESIKPSIFYGYKYLKNVIIPSGVTSIGREAFYQSSIESVTIPASVKSISGSSFYRCKSLQDINYTGTLSDWMSISFGTYTDNPLYYDEATNYQRKLKIDGSEVTSVTVPDDITSIPQFAFAGYKFLTSVEIGANVKNIGQYAFTSCSNLSNVTISESVSDLTIDKGVFNNNTSLTNITIPGGVKCIGESAFYGCSALGSITINNGVESIRQKAFYNCSALTSIVIPDSVQSVGVQTFEGCTSLKNMTLPFVGADPNAVEGSETTVFGHYFYRDTQYNAQYSEQSWAPYVWQGPLTSKRFNIPSSIKTVTVTGGNILYGTFSNCKNLTEIIIPNTLTRIPEVLFSGCSALTSVNIPDTVDSIGNNAFYNCSSLTGITIPNGVTSIGENSFSNCSALETINIPAAVKSLGRCAFYNCTNLSRIIYQGEIADWLGITIGDNLTNKLIPLYINDATADNIVIPDTITTINDYMFNYLDIKSITLGSAVTSIGRNAFANSGLTEITISANVSTIGDDVFYNCDDLQSVTIERADGVIQCTGSRLFGYGASGVKIYVPDDLVEAYQADTLWNTYDTVIKKVSEKPQP